MEVFSQMLWPLLACFVLVGIHAYLGIHVIARKVIFVDLALAQIAGLGAVYGVFLGLSFESDSLLIKAISVGFTFLGALLISMTRSTNERVPHEAIIGIIYASALSLTILLTSNLPHGAEEVQQMLAGSILWVRPQEVIQTALLYLFIGLIHITFRRQFFELSYNLAVKNTLTPSMRLWDFLFYATFGIVVTSSVGIGGVLLVFGYLVIPSVIGIIIADNLRSRLLIAWFVGVIMSILGVYFSYYADLPSGPTIVVFLSMALILVSLIKNKRKIVANLLIWGSVLILLIFITYIAKNYITSSCEDTHALRHQLEHHEDNPAVQQNLIKNLLQASSSHEILKGLNSIKPNMTELLDLVTLLLNNNDSLVRERAIQVISTLGWHQALASLHKAFKSERDDFICLEIAESVLSLGDKEGFKMLSRIWHRSKSDLARDDAIMHIQKYLPELNLKDQDLIKLIDTKSQKLEFDDKNSKYIIK